MGYILFEDMPSNLKAWRPEIDSEAKRLLQHLPWRMGKTIEQ
jgi:hypothetical protein